MPRFRFHVFNDDHTIDEKGKEFADIDAAKTYAAVAARDIMANELKSKGEIDLRHWIEIEDDLGDMTVITFAEAIKITPGSGPDLL